MRRTLGRRAGSLILAGILMAVFLACSEKPEAVALRNDPQEPVPAGALMGGTIRFQYAVYYLPAPAKDPQAVLRRLVSEREGGPAIVETTPEKPGTPTVCCKRCTQVQQEYAPPDMESLQYFGRGVTREQAEALQASRVAFLMDFAHDSGHVWPALQAADRIAEDLARETGGLLWDEQTREVFTPEEWHKRRVEGWADGTLKVSRHTVIHAYQDEAYVRAITLGMSEFGLPDVVVEDFSWSSEQSVGNLINLFCQAMAEGAVLPKPGEFDLDIRKIRNGEVREPQMQSLKPKATGVARLALKEGVGEDGDPQNRLIEIGFDRYPGGDVHVRQEKLLASCFGCEDSVVNVNHDEELLAASRRAKDKLPALRQEFAKGLQPGEFIEVKAPFERPDGGQEWMWVEVTAWKGKEIKGLLNNEPYYIPSLHAGQIVEVDQGDVFDYIRRYPDGRQEGNETGAIIEKMGQQEKGS